MYSEQRTWTFRFSYLTPALSSASRSRVLKDHTRMWPSREHETAYRLHASDETPVTLSECAFPSDVSPMSTNVLTPTSFPYFPCEATRVHDYIMPVTHADIVSHDYVCS